MSSRPATEADYRRLGVPIGVGEAELKAAFRKLAREHHPDHNPGDARAEARFKAVLASYEAIRQRPLLPGRTVGRPAAPVRPPAPTAPRPAPPPPRPAPRRAPPTRVGEMLVGDGLWVTYAAILVAPDRSCFVDPAAPGTPYAAPAAPVRLELRTTGFHAFVPPGPEHRWPITMPSRQDGRPVAALWVGDRQEGSLGQRGRGGSTALMPARLIEATVANIPLGARRWTVSSALAVDTGGSVWINTRESVVSEPSLGAGLRVELFGDGFHVHSDVPPERWRRREQPDARSGWTRVTVANLGGQVLRGDGVRL